MNTNKILNDASAWAGKKIFKSNTMLLVSVELLNKISELNNFGMDSKADAIHFVLHSMRRNGENLDGKRFFKTAYNNVILSLVAKIDHGENPKVMTIQIVEEL